jgi:NADPH:quinone reductase-like Zn-dependent oxidoreductase
MANPTMKAVRIHQYGGPEMLQYEDAPRPQPGNDDVLIRVYAAGVNPVDWKIRQGLSRQVLHYSMPLILGWDVSGIVEAVGAGATRLKIGDAVYSRPDIARDGAYAEYIIAKESDVAIKPSNIDHAHAAAIPLAALTAWQAIFDGADLRAGQRILIHAASGGVGGSAVQLAKSKGAYVIGTASKKNQDYVRGLGADEVIDYTSTRFEDVVHDVDVVFDTIGGDTQQRSWKVLKKGGIMVSTLTTPSQEEATAHGARGIHIFVQPNSNQLKEIAWLVESGKFKSLLEVVLPLSEARKAHELSQTGHTRGKIVLEPAA